MSVPGITNALLPEWAHIPTDTIQNLAKCLSRTLETVISIKADGVEVNSRLMPIVFEWDVQRAHISGMVRCPHTFSHTL